MSVYLVILVDSGDFSVCVSSCPNVCNEDISVCVSGDSSCPNACSEDINVCVSGDSS